MPDREAIRQALNKKADEVYKNNSKFRENVRSEKDKGRHGRDFLYSFMRHWLSGELKDRSLELFRKIPNEFKVGKVIS